MKRAMVFAVAAAVAVLAGCGSKDSDVEQLRAEQRQALSRLDEQVRALSAEVRRMREDLRELDGDLFALKGQYDYAPVARAGDGPRTGTATGGGSVASGPAVEEVPVEPIEANVEILAAELAKTRAEVKTLSQAYAADKELEELRDPRRTWEAMGDAEQLASRLDRLAQAHVASIEDETTRDQFLADIARVKDEIAIRANTSREEQLEAQKAELAERLTTETNERRREWVQRQLDALSGEDEEAIERQLGFALRGENGRQVGELARKYDISRDTLRDNGLQSFGGFGGGRVERRGGGR